MDTNIARIYFVDSNGNQIPIPNGITLRDTLNNTPSRLVAGNFFISWISNYSLFQNGVEICALKIRNSNWLKDWTDSPQKKHIGESTNKLSTPVIRKENANNFVNLYNNIIYKEIQNEITNQKVITCYYLFGKALVDRYEYYKTNNPKHTAQALV
ncbi:3847_t:CDS:2, partial [Dentiscutata erythropus]